jgi:hypothetical protein
MPAPVRATTRGCRRMISASFGGVISFILAFIAQPPLLRAPGGWIARLFLKKEVGGQAHQDAGEDFLKAAGGDIINQAGADLGPDNAAQAQK